MIHALAPLPAAVVLPSGPPPAFAAGDGEAAGERQQCAPER